MTKDEALKLAAQAVLDRWNSPKWSWAKQGPTADLMSDLQKALAQPEQEPVAQYIGECSEESLVQLYDDVKKGTNFYTTPPAAQQEPAGIVYSVPAGQVIGPDGTSKFAHTVLANDRLLLNQSVYATPPAALVQEPDCWAILTPHGSRLVSHDEAKGRKDAYPLYTTATRRTWVELTEEEIKILWVQYRAALPRHLCFAKAIKDKLKELNHD